MRKNLSLFFICIAFLKVVSSAHAGVLYNDPNNIPPLISGCGAQLTSVDQSQTAQYQSILGGFRRGLEILAEGLTGLQRNQISDEQIKNTLLSYWLTSMDSAYLRSLGIDFLSVRDTFLAQRTPQRFLQDLTLLTWGYAMFRLQTRDERSVEDAIVTITKGFRQLLFALNSLNLNFAPAGSPIYNFSLNLPQTTRFIVSYLSGLSGVSDSQAAAQWIHLYIYGKTNDPSVVLDRSEGPAVISVPSAAPVAAPAFQAWVVPQQALPGGPPSGFGAGGASDLDRLRRPGGSVTLPPGLVSLAAGGAADSLVAGLRAVMSRGYRVTGQDPGIYNGLSVIQKLTAVTSTLARVAADDRVRQAVVSIAGQGPEGDSELARGITGILAIVGNDPSKLLDSSLVAHLATVAGLGERPLGVLSTAQQAASLFSAFQGALGRAGSTRGSDEGSGRAVPLQAGATTVNLVDLLTGLLGRGNQGPRR